MLNCVFQNDILIFLTPSISECGLPLWFSWSRILYAGDLALIPGVGRSPGEGKGYLLQYSGLENSMNYIVHGVTKSWTGLSDFHFHIRM